MAALARTTSVFAFADWRAGHRRHRRRGLAAGRRPQRPWWPAGDRRVWSRRQRRRRSARRGGVALLLDLRLLAAQLAQVVELGPAHVTAGHPLDVVDDRRVHGERPLDAYPEADLADREGLAHPAALAADDNALEDLDPLAVALANPHVDLDGVTGTELRHVAPQGGGVDRVEGLHGDGSLLLSARRRGRCASGGDPLLCHSRRGGEKDLAQPSRSGRCWRVRRSDCSRRHFSTAAWSPETSTPGTSSPRQLAGRVYAGASSRRRPSGPGAKDSSTTDAALPMKPGSSLATASTTTSAAPSPPAST